MTARDAAERFARGSDRKIPPSPFRQEKAVEPPPPPRRIAPEEEETEPMYVTDQPRGQGCAGAIAQSLFYVALIGIVGVFALWAMSTGRLDTPATVEQRPTAAIEARPTSRPYPTSAAPAAAPVPTSDYGVAAYNEQQAARAAEYAQEATQEALGAAPDVLSTPLPGEFWTAAEKEAFAAADATATAVAWSEAQAQTDAFIQDIPTPAPEVVDDMAAKCGDADLVAKNQLLQLWCPPIIAAGED